MKQTTAHYDRVKEFMQLAGQDTPEGITIPDREVRLLYAKLILEEALETCTALGFRVWAGPELVEPKWCLNDEDTQLQLFDCITPNLEGIIDGCTDISVVTIGILIAFGLPDIPFLEETDKANLRKFEVPKCPACEEPMAFVQRETGSLAQPNSWWSCLFQENHEGPDFSGITPTLPREAGPYTRSDGKHSKPPYWTPPNHLQHIPEWIQ